MQIAGWRGRIRLLRDPRRRKASARSRGRDEPRLAASPTRPWLFWGTYPTEQRTRDPLEQHGPDSSRVAEQTLNGGSSASAMKVAVRRPRGREVRDPARRSRAEPARDKRALSMKTRPSRWSGRPIAARVLRHDPPAATAEVLATSAGVSHHDHQTRLSSSRSRSPSSRLAARRRFGVSSSPLSHIGVAVGVARADRGPAHPTAALMAKQTAVMPISRADRPGVRRSSKQARPNRTPLRRQTTRSAAPVAAG